jgi:enoyl-CoA hydratase/carnithine racemase
MATIELNIANRIATLTINRPASRNAMTLSMWRAMASYFRNLSADPDVGVIILTGAGDDFSTGADISEFGTVRADAAQAAVYEEAVDECSNAIQSATKPTIAALHGYCLGGGCHLAMACDFRVADASAKIGIPAAKLSIVYGVRSTQRLLSIVGLPRAKRILFSAERLDATEAHRIGFVDRVGADAIEVANAFAATMSESAPLSVAGAKWLLNGLAYEETFDHAKAERIIAHAADSDDYREGRDAFAQKRKPNFRGR